MEGSSSRVYLLAEFFAVVIAILGDFGFEEEAMTAAFGLDFFGRENEPGGRRFVGDAEHLVEVALFAGAIEIGLAGGEAFGFQILTGLGSVLQHSVKALFVHAEIYE